MLLNMLALSLCSNIDAIGIGISYGIRNIKIEKFSKIIMFLLSLVISSISFFLGDILFSFFPDTLSKLAGILLLIIIGIYIIFTSCPNTSTSFDKDQSQTIDWKESIALGISLSLDSICVCVSATTFISNNIIFSVFISVFQLIFLTAGYILGKYLSNISKIPDNIWGILSGILFIFIAILKIF